MSTDNDEDSHTVAFLISDHPMLNLRLQSSAALEALSRAAETVTALLGEPTELESPHGRRLTAGDRQRVAQMVKELASAMNTDNLAELRIAHALLAAATALDAKDHGKT